MTHFRAMTGSQEWAGTSRLGVQLVAENSLQLLRQLVLIKIFAMSQPVILHDLAMKPMKLMVHLLFAMKPMFNGQCHPRNGAPFFMIRGCTKASCL